jgi:hypothetical protein
MKQLQTKSLTISSALLLVALLLSACGTAAAPQPARAASQVPFKAPTGLPVTMPMPTQVESATKIDPLVFQQTMRKLWEDHITWTRLYIISSLAGLPEADATAQRLLQNQVDIGNAIKPFYGDKAGEQLTALLKDHILIAADLLAAAKSGDNAKFEDSHKRWHENANQIAAFLNSANPDNWPLSDMKSVMNTHLELTLDEASARLKSDWPGDVAAYDKVHAEILDMSDMLASGIIKQFPDKFAPQQASQQTIGLTLAMDKLWEDHITWTRVYIVSVTSGLHDADVAAQRLLQNQVDIGNAIKPLYGDKAGEQPTALLKDHIMIAADLLAAAKSDDNAKFEDANKRWTENANQIAAFLNSANPDNWPLSDMQSMMKSHLDLTLGEATARLKSDWPGDIAAYDKVHAEILQMSGMLTKGILAQFPDKFK